jgi:galactitol-specific phosphotransferase system IIB component
MISNIKHDIEAIFGEDKSPSRDRCVDVVIKYNWTSLIEAFNDLFDEHQNLSHNQVFDMLDDFEEKHSDEIEEKDNTASLLVSVNNYASEFGYNYEHELIAIRDSENREEIINRLVQEFEYNLRGLTS